MVINKLINKDKLAMKVSERRRVKNYLQGFTWSAFWTVTSFETENTSEGHKVFQGRVRKRQRNG